MHHHQCHASHVFCPLFSVKCYKWDDVFTVAEEEESINVTHSFKIADEPYIFERALIL